MLLGRGELREVIIEVEVRRRWVERVDRKLSSFWGTRSSVQ